jgi:hypothetical protein
MASRRGAIDFERDECLVSGIVEFGKHAGELRRTIAVKTLQAIRTALGSYFQVAVSRMVVKTGDFLAFREGIGRRSDKRAGVGVHRLKSHHLRPEIK